MSAAAKMVADSTQSDVSAEQCGSLSKEPVDNRPERSHVSKVKHRKTSDGKKNKKLKKSAKKAMKKRSSNSTADEDNPDLDLSKVVKAIGEFIKDRQEMVNQMFGAVKGSSLHRALPDILKGLPLEELKRRCVEHLEVMSRKRILRILAGDDPATISSSGTEEESEDDLTNRETKLKVKTQSQAADSTSQTGECHSDLEESAVHGVNDQQIENVALESSNLTAETMDSFAESQDEDRSCPVSAADVQINLAADESEGEVVMEDEVRGQVSEDEGECSSGEDEESGVMSADCADDDADVGDDGGVRTTSDSLSPVLTKNQMELLELEMRAKAIKAMLNKMKK